MLDQQQVNRILSSEVKRCVVALSGGADSVALLHFVANLEHVSPVFALHINHGMQAQADSWQQFCENFCASMGVELHSISVSITDKGSVEERARNARYQAFEEFLLEGDLLLIAHHGNDQVETIMLNLLRGSDAFGVRGMPEERSIGRAILYRPMLGMTRTDVLSYCRGHGLKWVEDNSNLDESLDRNFLRHSILPQLSARFPSLENALLGALDRDEEISRFVESVANADLDNALAADGGIVLETVAGYEKIRRVNLLRQFLILKNIPLPTGRQLRECAQVMVSASSSAAPSMKWSSYKFVRHQGCIYLLHLLPETDKSSVPFKAGETTKFGGGIFSSRQVLGGGILIGENASIELRVRVGGEKIRQQQLRTLKNVFQESNVPSWLRYRLPLVFVKDQLVAIPAIPCWNIPAHYAEGYRAALGESGWEFSFDIVDRV